MSFLAIVAATPTGRVAKYAEFDLETEADAHVVTFGGFVAAKPAEPRRDWLIDMVGETLTISTAPPDVRQESPLMSAVRLLADDAIPATKAQILALLGPAP